jgi:hypothetical protein
VVVLGTGWGAHAFLQSIDAIKYEVVVVSPRKCLFFPSLIENGRGGERGWRGRGERRKSEEGLKLDIAQLGGRVLLGPSMIVVACSPFT